nr:uncharacterized protein LOC104650486 [Saimiri boliviensis boliviensis]
MNSWGFLKHNCVTQETQVMATLTDGSCRAPVCYSKPSPLAFNQAGVVSCRSLSRCPRFPPPRARQGRGGPDRRRAPPVHVTGWEGEFSSSSVPKPRLLQRGCGFLLCHHRNDRRSTQSRRDS